MSDSALHLMELLSSKICHDLVSPIGAIHNGLELMTELGMGADDSVIGLIDHSAKMASARLKVFRIAYGLGGGSSDIKPADVHAAIDELVTSENKITQDWSPQTDLSLVMMPTGLSKVMTCILMLCCESLPRGGTINVKQDSPESITFTAKGTDARVKPGITEALAGTTPTTELEPTQVHSHITGLILRAYDFTLTQATEDDCVTWHLNFPE